MNQLFHVVGNDLTEFEVFHRPSLVLVHDMLSTVAAQGTRVRAIRTLERFVVAMGMHCADVYEHFLAQGRGVATRGTLESFRLVYGLEVPGQTMSGTVLLSADSAGNVACFHVTPHVFQEFG